VNSFFLRVREESNVSENDKLNNIYYKCLVSNAEKIYIFETCNDLHAIPKVRLPSKCRQSIKKSDTKSQIMNC
jgi:hypothetical protein